MLRFRIPHDPSIPPSAFVQLQYATNPNPNP
jgi:hypothetical protein